MLAEVEDLVFLTVKYAITFSSKISTCIHKDRIVLYFYMQKFLVILQMQYSQQYRNMKYSLLADTSSEGFVRCGITF